MFKKILALALAGMLAFGAVLAEEGGDDVRSGQVDAPVAELAPVELCAPQEPLEIMASEAADPEPTQSPEFPVAEPVTTQEPEPQRPLPGVISLTKSATKTVYPGNTYQIEVPGKKIKSCRSSSKKIAVVTKAGLVTPKKTGKAKITVTLSSGKKLTLTLKVSDPRVPASVAITEGSKRTLAVGDTLLLTATVSPATADQAVTWKSDKKSVASVDASGAVTARKPGRATIRAVTANKKEASFTVTVKHVVYAPYMISHALGGIGGLSYSNCLEAFEQNYAEGHRIFEADFNFTSDGKLVLCHDWNRQLSASFKKGKAPSYADFMGARIFDQYTPMSAEDLLWLMNLYPDITVITDTKFDDTATVKKQFGTLVETARALGVEPVLDRLTVEIYNQKMLSTVRKIYPFKSYVFTLYKLFKSAPSKSQLKAVSKFCAENGVGVVAMYAKWWKPSYDDIIASYGLDCALYTTNSASDAARYFDQGVTALFTDFLPPS